MTVAELLSRISSAELTEWKALYAIEAAEQNAARETSRAHESKTQRPP